MCRKNTNLVWHIVLPTSPTTDSLVSIYLNLWTLSQPVPKRNISEFYYIVVRSVNQKRKLQNIDLALCALVCRHSLQFSTCLNLLQTFPGFPITKCSIEMFATFFEKQKKITFISNFILWSSKSLFIIYQHKKIYVKIILNFPRAVINIGGIGRKSTNFKNICI